MKFILSRFSVGGIKNLTKPINIEFMNYKSDQNEGSRYKNIHSFKNVTAIYGPNGSGKSAIIHGIEILLNLLGSRNFLNKSENEKYINALINKKTNMIILEIDFYAYSDSASKKTLFRYTIEIQKNKMVPSDIDITKEELSIIKPTKHFLFSIIDGEIQSCKKISKALLDKAQGKILNRTFYDVFFHEIVLKLPSEIIATEKQNFTWLFMPIHVLLDNISYHLDDPDCHPKYRIDDEHLKSQAHDILSGISIDHVFKFQDNFVSVQDIKHYEEYIKNLTMFIKFFKPDLLGIDIKKKLNDDIYEINLEFVYPDYSIDKDLESVGIKKLCDLFYLMHDLHEGKILFIDELDSTINDVYLVKLIEYFADYCKGQIIFTTHNTSPMDIMNNKHRRERCQICFLDSENNLHVWKNVGCFSPSSLYKKGQIKGLPFSIEAYDFLDSFKIGEK